MAIRSEAGPDLGLYSSLPASHRPSQARSVKGTTFFNLSLWKTGPKLSPNELCMRARMLKRPQGRSRSLREDTQCLLLTTKCLQRQTLRPLRAVMALDHSVSHGNQ